MLPKLHLNIERWKFNKELGIYVSSWGNFKTKDKTPIKPMTSSNIKYLSIRVDNKCYLAHRVVLSTFKPVKDKTLTVDHKDHNTKNNHLDNLEWCTISENQQRAKEDLLEVAVKTVDIEYSPEMELIYNAAIARNIEKCRQGQSKKSTAPQKRNPETKYGVKRINKGKCVCFGEYRVKSCHAAAIIILNEQELPHSQIDIQRTASRIGEVIGKNQTLYGYKFERRVLE